MSKNLEQEKVDEWFKKFQETHPSKIDDTWMSELGIKLCVEKPLGEDASNRLANWIFVHLNQTRMTEEEIKITLQRIETARESYDRVLVELSVYKDYIDDVFHMVPKNDNLQSR